MAKIRRRRTLALKFSRRNGRGLLSRYAAKLWHEHRVAQDAAVRRNAGQVWLPF